MALVEAGHGRNADQNMHLRRNRMATWGEDLSSLVGVSDEFEPYALELQMERIETYVLGQVTLPFRPPYIEKVARPESFEMWWKWLVYVFELQDPAQTPAVTRPLAESVRGPVERYMASVQDLLDSSLLNVDQGFAYDISAAGVEENLRHEFVSREVSRGIGITFRQFHAASELASLESVFRALNAHLQAEPSPIREDGQRVLGTWRKAHNRLGGHSLMQLVRQRMIAEGVITGPYETYLYERPPLELISLYEYGDLIHWGRRRGELANIQTEDPVLEGMYRITFMESMFVYAHIYLGFAKVIDVMIGTAR